MEFCLSFSQKIFPIDYIDDPEDCEMIDRKERFELYEQCRESAMKIFENQFGVKKKPKPDADALSVDMGAISPMHPQQPGSDLGREIDISAVNFSE